VTFFCLPKAFEGHFGVIQRNALRSWRALDQEATILVFGDEPGCAEAAAQVGAIHLPRVRRNEFGTPLLDDAFTQASRHAKGGHLCYLNADIILTDDFTSTARRAAHKFGGALVVGRRWNTGVTEPIEFSEDPTWQREFRREMRASGRLYDGWNIDYFLFPSDLVRDIPAFAVGRPAWDNWMIYEARRRRIPVIDATHAITAIHQNHDYTHTPEGRSGGKEAVWFGVEAERNRALAEHRLFSIEDATHLATAGGPIVPNIRPSLLMHQARVASELYPEWRVRLRPLFAAERFCKKADHAFRLFMLRRGIDLFPNKEKRLPKV